MIKKAAPVPIGRWSYMNPKRERGRITVLPRLRFGLM